MMKKASLAGKEPARNAKLRNFEAQNVIKGRRRSVEEVSERARKIEGDLAMKEREMR